MTRPLTTSPFGRLLRVGSLAARVTTSLAVERTLRAGLSDPIANLRRTENAVRNAMRVTEALGELKGAAMKIGQMLAVHEGLLPPEVCAVLQSLQRDAPAVPFDRMGAVLEAEVAGGLAIFAQFDTQPLAAASIGQVYRARLRDGRDVAVKVQYPDIDRVVAADLKNLKKLVGSLVAMFVDIDFDPFWQELKERLLEELDYRQEAHNAARMASLYADDPAIIVPDVIAEASGHRVLTMAFVPGIHPDRACTPRYSDALRSQWGERHLAFVIRGLMQHRFLHADPNFGNYAFREDGAMVVYDHGCVKAISSEAADACARVLGTILNQDAAGLPDALFELGVYDRRTHARVERDLIDPIGRELMSMVRGQPYRFTSQSSLYNTLLGHGGRYLAELSRLELPAELTFVNRTLTGVFGNLCRLQAQARWRDVLAPYAQGL